MRKPKVIRFYINLSNIVLSEIALFLILFKSKIPCFLKPPEDKYHYSFKINNGREEN